MANKLKFRVGLEIETSFEGTSKTINGANTCLLKNIDLDHYGVVILPTTHEPKTSLFRGKPELVAASEDDKKYCNVELIINPNREIFFDGENLIDEKNESVMQEYIKAVKEWKGKKIIKCGKYGTGLINYPEWTSTCGVHLHISAPFMVDEDENKKKLYKILVFYLWYTKYQDKFGTLNENWIHGFKGKCKNWRDAPYLTAKANDDGSLEIGKEEDLFNLPNYETLNRLLTQSEQLQSEIEKIYNKLPGADYINWKSNSRGVTKSNIIIVDNRFGNQFPHFEFRGHNDIMVKNYSTCPASFFTYDKLPNTPLIDYIKAVYNFLEDAYKILKGEETLPILTQSGGKKNKKKTHKKKKKKRLKKKIKKKTYKKNKKNN